ncbi:MAG: YgiQ family radical SAM protein [Leptospiraceae bacterium]|nr:YgiQ family radical SAM protein [Leptospiraceae bacterium]MCP5494278.1 YgiQ family radical SAM protein [Leptospiraceae bacterium]
MAYRYQNTDWLPTSVKEVEALQWNSLDVILFSGDAYIDHPSFGIAVIGRLLQKIGLKVAIVPQPNWRDDLRDFKKLGKPNLFFGVSAGNMDSMVNHYTANLRKRSDDAYTPDGKAGFRPDYACSVYTSILKKMHPDVPVVIGGIEASLRRLCHYDYWSNSLKPSVLVESQADFLIYGMGEKPLLELAKKLKQGLLISEIKDLNQTAYLQPKTEILEIVRGWETIPLHSYEECLKDKILYAKNFKIFEVESNRMKAARLVEASGENLVVVNPQFGSYSQLEIDMSFDLPYTRLPHPRYEKKGNIPAYEMIKNSINIHRGCFGGCSFCTISAHQGKFVQSRSEESVLKEVNQLINTPGFKGTITDLGGPSANMYKMKGIDEKVCEKCKKPSCIFPKVCPNLKADHSPLINLYKKVESIKGVKHLFVGSGLRYDLIYGSKKEFLQKGKEYLKALVSKYVSGRLKVAPEHTSDNLLKLMRKPSFEMFKVFKKDFDAISNRAGKQQQLIPYFISSHPGSEITDMANLAAHTKELNYKLEQVQDFTPTPMTLATTIYYTGINPYTMEKVYTPKTKEEKLEQNSFFFWYKPEMKQIIRNKLTKIKRFDLLKKILE